MMKLNFDEIKNVKKFEEMNEEHKMRLNLSSFAMSVIESDKTSFAGLGYQDKSRNFILNDIFRCMCEYYESDEKYDCAFAYSVLSEKYNELSKISGNEEYKAEQIEKEKNRILQYVGDLMSRDDGNVITITVEERNCWYLEDCYEATCYGEYSWSKFFKCVLESYARKEYILREKIICGSRIDEIEKAISTKCKLKVTISSGSGAQNFTVNPYKIMANSMNTYLYLVGKSVKSDDPEGKEIIASFRISRISKIKATKKSAFLSKAEKAELDEKIKAAGVMYLAGEPAAAEVILDRQGVFMYNRILNGRIPCEVKPQELPDGRYLYMFNSTEMQIKNYFFQFGKSAEIKSPENLRKIFAEDYRKALEMYEK